MEDKNTINRLLDELEKKSELIAALRAEIAMKDKRIAELTETNAILELKVSHCQQETRFANEVASCHRDARRKKTAELHQAKKHIAELETQLAATLTTIEAALPDGRAYSEGCAP